MDNSSNSSNSSNANNSHNTNTNINITKMMIWITPEIQPTRMH